MDGRRGDRRAAIAARRGGWCLSLLAAARVLDVLPGGWLALGRVRVRRGTVWGEDGGGIRNRGTLTLSDTIVSSNKVFDGRGGGIHAAAGSSTTLVNSTVTPRGRPLRYQQLAGEGADEEGED